MATEAITIKVDSEAARVFNSAPAEEQRKMEALLSLWLKEIAAADARPLKEVMDEIGREARRRGMTQRHWSPYSTTSSTVEFLANQKYNVEP